MSDSVDYPIAFFGAIRAGIVVIPLNTWLSPRQYSTTCCPTAASAR